MNCNHSRAKLNIEKHLLSSTENTCNASPSFTSHLSYLLLQGGQNSSEGPLACLSTEKPLFFKSDLNKQHRLLVREYMEKFDKVEHILKGFLAMHNICVSSKMWVLHWNIGRLNKIKIITENFNMTVLGQFANAMKVNLICQFEKLPHTPKNCRVDFHWKSSSKVQSVRQEQLLTSV